jgi:hypothetical protein
MPSDHDFRLQFREWLIQHDLAEPVADAILESLPPFDWSDIARKSETNARFDRSLVGSDESRPMSMK